MKCKVHLLIQLKNVCVRLCERHESVSKKSQINKSISYQKTISDAFPCAINCMKM